MKPGQDSFRKSYKDNKWTPFMTKGERAQFCVWNTLCVIVTLKIVLTKTLRKKHAKTATMGRKTRMKESTFQEGTFAITACYSIQTQGIWTHSYWLLHNRHTSFKIKSWIESCNDFFSTLNRNSKWWNKTLMGWDNNNYYYYHDFRAASIHFSQTSSEKGRKLRKISYWLG